MLKVDHRGVWISMDYQAPIQKIRWMLLSRSPGATKTHFGALRWGTILFEMRLHLWRIKGGNWKPEFSYGMGPPRYKLVSKPFYLPVTIVISTIQPLLRQLNAIDWGPHPSVGDGSLLNFAHWLEKPQIPWGKSWSNLALKEKLSEMWETRFLIVFLWCKMSKAQNFAAIWVKTS